MTKYLHELLDIPLFDIVFLSLPIKDGAYIKWTLRLISFLAHLRRKYTWKNHRGFKYKIGGHMFSIQRKPFMG